MARLSIRIDFEPSGSALGPGMAELLERIGEAGSIRKAAIAMNMSYRKAWLLLQGLQRTFGGPVVVTETGGAAGGGARLTELGTKLFRTYRTVEKTAARAVESDMLALAALVQKDAAPRGKPDNMNVYRLDPMILSHPSWQASSIKELLFVGAGSDKEAREFAAKKTIAMVTAARFAAKLHSPWLDSKITSCVLDPSKTDVNEGEVVTANGRSLPIA
jgi:molybdate transport system regulatory protein